MILQLGLRPAHWRIHSQCRTTFQATSVKITWFLDQISFTYLVLAVFTWNPRVTMKYAPFVLAIMVISIVTSNFTLLNDCKVYNSVRSWICKQEYTVTIFDSMWVMVGRPHNWWNLEILMTHWVIGDWSVGQTAGCWGKLIMSLPSVEDALAWLAYLQIIPI